MKYQTFYSEFADYSNARRSHWDNIIRKSSWTWGHYYNQYLRKVYRHLIPEGATVLELGCGEGDLLAYLKPARGVGIDFSEEAIAKAAKKHPEIQFICADAHQLDIGVWEADYIILSELVNDVWDVQHVLEQAKRYCHPGTRLVFNFYSHLWNMPMRVGEWLGVATHRLPQNWLTPHDMINMLEITGFQRLRNWEEVVVPIPIPLLSFIANRYLVRFPPFRWLAMTNFMVARPLIAPSSRQPRVSVIVAARNESGHIEELLLRIPSMGGGTEVIFVEGNSSDDTFEVIERTLAKYPAYNGRLLKQPGKGKGDAVRTGFDAATGDILMILDADITVPPEDLPRFFSLLADGSAEFVNGVRLVYPMEEAAMRFFNLLGNKFFSWAFSWLIGQPIRDTLCGTKVLWKKDYERIVQNRAYFGDFDPFGDFDLLFGAARLNLKIVEVPIRYRARRYGETNISRWRHGWLLLRMVVFAMRRLKFI